MGCQPEAISRCACHFNLLTALGLVHEAIQKPGCDTITWAFFCILIAGQSFFVFFGSRNNPGRCRLHVLGPPLFFCAADIFFTGESSGNSREGDGLKWIPIQGIMSYLQFLLIASERVELTPQRLKCLSFCMHLMKILLIISSAHSETTFRFAVLQSIAAAMRFCPVIVFLDPWMSIPFQVLYTAMEMLLGPKTPSLNRQSDRWNRGFSLCGCRHRRTPKRRPAFRKSPEEGRLPS